MKRDHKHLEGKRIKLVRCNDPYTKLKPGLLGTVSMVDSIGTVHVSWDDGSTLGLCYDDGDRWEEVHAPGELTPQMRATMTRAGIDPDAWLKKARAPQSNLVDLLKGRSS